MNKESQGYVYILTNPSFIQNRIKIGRTKNPLDVRSHQLFNTALPTPFEKYASIKTAKYIELESSIHDILDLLTDTRVNKKREFFDVSPEDALQVFRAFAKTIEDAVVILYNKDGTIKSEESNVLEIKEVEKEIEKEVVQPAIPALPISQEIVMDDVPKGSKFSFDGKKYYGMAAFVYYFVEAYEMSHKLTFAALNEVFKESMLEPSFREAGFLAMCEIVSQLSEKAQAKRYAANRTQPLQSKDGIQFYVNNQWTRPSVANIFKVAQDNGWAITVQAGETTYKLQMIPEYNLWERKKAK